MIQTVWSRQILIYQHSKPQLYNYLLFTQNQNKSFNLKCISIYLKLSYPIEKFFLLPAGFELRILLLAFDADTLTNRAIAHSKFQIQHPGVLIASLEPSDHVGLILFIDCVSCLTLFTRFQWISIGWTIQVVKVFLTRIVTET